VSTTATTHDPLLAKVIHRRLEAACEEAAITLNRTSGSPIVTEANDFSTSLLSVTGDVIAFTSYLPPHFVSAINCVRDLLANVDLDTVRPGDHFAANDPHTAHPLHSADPSVITPVFAEGELVAWAYSSVHVLDVGGLTPGGWIPGSYDRYGEGFLFPITKVVDEGVWDEQFVKFYLANVRMAESLNDLRSCVAANNTTARRLEEVFERYGAETVKDYAEYNIALSEAHARQRIAELPDGTYTAHDWVEYDGHGIETMSRLSVSVTVRGDELLIDLSDSPPEANCFINATRAALLGWVLGDLIRALMPDLPINSGVIRPLKVIKAEPGTMLNPSKNAATSAGHMESGTKVMRAFHCALHKAIGLSPNPEVRSRMAGLGANVAPHNVVFGLTAEGAPLMWVSFDSLGTGLGAQSNIDGRECGCYEDMTGSRMLDIELEESAPTLHYYRRLCPNSGGHGFRRGGMGIDTAWRTLGMSRTQMTVFSNVTRVPSRAPGGGYPGGGTGNLIFEHGIEHDSPTDLGARFIEEDLTEGSTLPPSHATNLQMNDDDITRTYGAGGSGIGDPLFREPWRVLEDLENAMITAPVVDAVYGVAIGADGMVDEEATAARRRELRAARLGAEPSREAAPMEVYRPPLTVAGESLVCSHCEGDLGPVEGNWKERAKVRRRPLVDVAAELGAKVRPTGVIDLETVEFVCPSCGSMLEVDNVEAGEEIYQDIRLGHTRSEPGEAF
jgi:N-methylhydantoinase B